MKETLQNIQNKIAEINELKYVDENWGQLDDYSPHPPTQWPCALIDISNLVFADIGVDRTASPQNRQTATGTVVVNLANAKLGNTSFKAPQQQKDNAWGIWELEQKIHEKLHGWKPHATSGALMRTRLQRKRRDDGIQEYEITYTIGMTNK